MASFSIISFFFIAIAFVEGRFSIYNQIEILWNNSFCLSKSIDIIYKTRCLSLGLPPPRFGKEFGSPQLDEVGDASLQVDVSAISKMYRKREEALNTAIKTVKDIAKANNKNKGT